MVLVGISKVLKIENTVAEALTFPPQRKQTRGEYSSPDSKWKPMSSRKPVKGLVSPFLLGTWNIFSVEIYPFLAPSK